jgi:hypothetical protein
LFGIGSCICAQDQPGPCSSYLCFSK